MCGPIGEIADVFVRWCMEYRKGKVLNQQNAQRIAWEVDSRFAIDAIQLDKSEPAKGKYKVFSGKMVLLTPKKNVVASELKVNPNRRKLIEASTKIMKKRKSMKYVGTYLFLPVSNKELNTVNTPSADFARYCFGVLGLYVGGGKCISDSFGHKKGVGGVILFAFCDKLLYQQIRSKPRIGKFDYWYRNTKGKEKKKFRKILDEIDFALKELYDEVKKGGAAWTPWGRGCALEGSTQGSKDFLAHRRT